MILAKHAACVRTEGADRPPSGLLEVGVVIIAEIYLEHRFQRSSQGCARSVAVCIRKCLIHLLKITSYCRKSVIESLQPMLPILCLGGFVVQVLALRICQRACELRLAGFGATREWPAVDRRKIRIAATTRGLTGVAEQAGAIKRAYVFF